MKLDSMNIEAQHTQRELAQAEAEARGQREAEDPGSIATVTLSYRNWRGEVSDRKIFPTGIRFGSTDWHPEPQWLLTAFDIEKGAYRDFALKDFGQPMRCEADDTTIAAQSIIIDRLQGERGALISAAAYEAEKRGAVGAADAIRALSTGSILEPVQEVPA